MNICYEQEAAGFAICSRLERPRTQTPLEAGGEHTHTYLLDDFPNPIACLWHGAAPTASSKHGSNAVAADFTRPRCGQLATHREK